MTKEGMDKAASIVRDAGGRIIGRTKLQKISYILEVAGLGDGFAFEYHHYGPYSEGLTSATRDAVVLGLISEKEGSTSWGGFYSIYEIDMIDEASDGVRSKIARLGASANSVELELAATALFLGNAGENDPWGETARRKPDKADGGRLERARNLYRELRSFETPNPLPEIG